jgi:hypothetical protein
MKHEMIAAGQWYRRPDTRDMFQVVDWDEEAGSARIQMFDGSLDEIDEDTWRALSPEGIEPPDDWTGPLDGLDVRDIDGLVTHTDDLLEESYFRDDREPWESLLIEDAVAA